MSINIIEGENKYLEKQVAEVEQKGDAESKKVEELEAQKKLLKEQLQTAEEKQIDTTPFWNRALILQKGIN